MFRANQRGGFKEPLEMSQVSLDDDSFRMGDCTVKIGDVVSLVVNEDTKVGNDIGGAISVSTRVQNRIIGHSNVTHRATFDDQSMKIVLAFKEKVKKRDSSLVELTRLPHEDFVFTFR